jgi:hypothetical protein
VLETLLAALLLMTLGATALALTSAADALVVAGVWIVAAGLAFGVPTGLLYHVALHRSLTRAGTLPPRWWLRPTTLHDRIPADDRGRVLGWCAAGAAGFGVTVVGMIVMAVGAIRML